MKTLANFALAAAFLTFSASATAQDSDPLSATIELEDAERFIAVWNESDGQPTAEQLQQGYIDPGSEAVEVFTPGRIRDGDHLAATIAANPSLYAEAVERCYPLLTDLDGELRATYLALSGLLPEKPLPRIAVVFGANNSGGTAGSGMQVLGLEVLCRMADDEADVRELMRSFFAHETVHTMQDIDRRAAGHDMLLAYALAEGGPDFIGSLVTGRSLVPDRDAWALENEDFVWEQFAADRALVRNPGSSPEEIDAAIYRWFGNAGNPPEGWPSELGYWVGSRISAGYVENARDPHVAIRQLLSFGDPHPILDASGLADRFED